MQGSGRYSQYARRAMMQARLCAHEQRHTLVDTSHLLVGVLRVEGCIGQQVLKELGLTRETAEHAVALLHLRRPAESFDPAPMSPALRAALTYAVEESGALGHHYVGTEHLLLGIARSGSGAAQDILQASAIGFDQLRRQVRRTIGEGQTEIGMERALRMARLSELTRRVLNRAAQVAREMHAPRAGLVHLVLALGQEQRSPAGQMLRECGLDADQLVWDLATGALESSPAEFEEVLDDAVLTAERLGSHYTGTDHIVLALTLNRHGMRLLTRYNVDLFCLQHRATSQIRAATHTPATQPESGEP
ncbi:MAG: hypothetical protein Kow0077_19260 [Anaerolineae bacterium]